MDILQFRPPERIEGESKEAYGVQADVWSLGITLVFKKFFFYFKMISRLKLQMDNIHMGSGKHHLNSSDKSSRNQHQQWTGNWAIPTVFMNLWHFGELNAMLACLFFYLSLTKNFRERPKYKELLEHPFLVKAKTDTEFDASEFVSSILV